MSTTAQIRAARGLPKWARATLAQRAALSTVTLNMIENDATHPRETTLHAIRSALEAGVVEFLGEKRLGLGVRYRAGRTA